MFNKYSKSEIGVSPADTISHLNQMTDEAFDSKYNAGPQHCAGCNRKLHFLNKPMFGIGKLSDGNQICSSCYARITFMNQEFGLKFKSRYNSLQIRDFLQRKKEIPQSWRQRENRSAPLISGDHFAMIADVSDKLEQIKKKLEQDAPVVEKIRQNLPSSNIKEFISGCVAFDLVSVIRFLKDDLKSFDLREAASLVLVFNKILPQPVSLFAVLNDKTINNRDNLKKISDMAEKIIETVGTENPVNLQITYRDGVREEQGEKPTPDLSLPLWLFVTNSNLFDDYCTALYRFAIMIAKADGIETEAETGKLKQLYQTIHHPDGRNNPGSVANSSLDPEETLEQILEELHSLTGLARIREEVMTLINFIRMQQEREKAGLKLTELSHHIVFTGNPGTGKTTVARMIARIYRHLGILKRGHLVETDRSGLVAEYVGQTAVKVNRIVDSALDGVLFIDEAYSLVGENRDDFGKEAVATLIRRMENDRGKLVVILAGYSEEMKDFIESNPGLKSRFNRYFEFDDYTPDQLVEIFERQCAKLDYIPDEPARLRLKEVVGHAYRHRDQSFGNARFIRNLFEKTIGRQANRIAAETNMTREILSAIKEVDIPENESWYP